MIVTIFRDGQYIADLKVDDMRDWADVCNAIREKMFPNLKPPERDLKWEEAMKTHGKVTTHEIQDERLKGWTREAREKARAGAKKQKAERRYK